MGRAAAGAASSRLGEILMGLPERKRQAAEDEQRRRFDDVALAEKNVRPGPVPTRSRQIVALTPEPVQFDDELFREPVSAMASPTAPAIGRFRDEVSDEPFMAVPKFGGYTPEPIEEEDPNFMAVGDWGHVERPEARARRERDEEQERRESGMAPFLPPGVNPAEAAAGRDAGLPWEAIMGGEPEDDRLTGSGGRRFKDTPEDRADLLAWQAEMAAAGRAPDDGNGPARRINPTYLQAREALIEAQFEGETLSPGELHRRAMQMANGEEPLWTQPLMQPSFDTTDVSRRLLAARPSGAPAPAEVPEPVEDEPPPEPVEATGSRRTITADEAEYLRTERGMSDEEIRALYDVR